jgi:hypothetical protein
MVTKDI